MMRQGPPYAAKFAHATAAVFEDAVRWLAPRVGA